MTLTLLGVLFVPLVFVLAFLFVVLAFGDFIAKVGQWLMSMLS